MKHRISTIAFYTLLSLSFNISPSIAVTTESEKNVNSETTNLDIDQSIDISQIVAQEKEEQTLTQDEDNKQEIEFPFKKMDKTLSYFYDALHRIAFKDNFFCYCDTRCKNNKTLAETISELSQQPENKIELEFTGNFESYLIGKIRAEFKIILDDNEIDDKLYFIIGLNYPVFKNKKEHFALNIKDLLENKIFYNPYNYKIRFSNEKNIINLLLKNNYDVSLKIKPPKYCDNSYSKNLEAELFGNEKKLHNKISLTLTKS